jgi:hypothetical protein
LVKYDFTSEIINTTFWKYFFESHDKPTNLWWWDEPYYNDEFKLDGTVKSGWDVRTIARRRFPWSNLLGRKRSHPQTKINLTIVNRLVLRLDPSSSDHPWLGSPTAAAPETTIIAVAFAIVAGDNSRSTKLRNQGFENKASLLIRRLDPRDAGTENA